MSGGLRAGQIRRFETSRIVLVLSFAFLVGRRFMRRRHGLLERAGFLLQLKEDEADPFFFGQSARSCRRGHS